MSKITLLILGGCVLFGLLNLATSEKGVATPQEDAEGNPDISERMGPREEAAPNAVYRQRPNPLTLPSQSPLQMSHMSCYSCTDCPKILSNTSTKLCPFTKNPANQGCVVYAEQYKHMKKSWYIRGCASERGSCADITKAHALQGDIVSLLFCNECEGDGCNTNGASRSITNIMAFFVLVIVPLIGKFTLS